MNGKRIVLLLGTLVLICLLLSTCQSPEITSAKVYLQQNNLPAAEEQLMIAMGKEPANPEVPFLLATTIYGPQRDWKKAGEMLDKAEELSADYKSKVENQRKQYWGELYNDGANTFNEAGRALFEMEKDSIFNLAADKFLKSIQMKADEATSYNGIVKCYYSAKDTQKVEKFAKMAFDNNVFDEDVIDIYCRILWETERKDQAFQVLDEQLAKNPNITDLQLLKIEFLANSERVEEALAAAKNLVNNNPDNIDYRFNLAQIYAMAEDYESAQYEYQKLLSQNPDDLEILIRITNAAYQSEDWVMAEEYARRLIAIEEDNRFGYQILFNSLMKQQRKEEAEEYFKIYKSLD